MVFTFLQLGWTPLHWTTCAGKLDLVKILVEEFGAKTSVKTVVCRKCRSSRWFSSLSVFVRVRSQDGETPMDLGRSQQHVVEYFATVDSESKG